MLKMLVALTNCAVICLLSSTAVAQEFFGGTDLDYWNDGLKPMAKPRIVEPTETPKATNLAAQTPVPGGSVIRQMDSKPFDWKNYEDPKSDVFWDEGGDYIPPRPFRVVAAEPTSENVAKLLQWMQKKMSLTKNLETTLKRQGGSSEQKLLPSKDISVEKAVAVSWKQMQIVYFYQSTCPHCQKSTPVVAELRRLGAQVIPVQLDWKTSQPLVDGSVKYDSALASAHPITGTPTWVISYRGVTEEIQGETSPEAIASRFSSSPSR